MTHADQHSAPGEKVSQIQTWWEQFRVRVAFARQIIKSKKNQKEKKEERGKKKKSSMENKETTILLVPCWRVCPINVRNLGTRHG